MGEENFQWKLQAISFSRVTNEWVLQDKTDKYLVDNPIAGGEEGEDVGHEVSLVVREALPILVVVREVELFRGPERRLCLLVHLPHLHAVT